MKLSPIVLAEMILQDAIDYISNDMTKFCADNYAVQTMRNNENFRKTVIDEVKSNPEEYGESCSWQRSAADFVWSMYKKWAYGDL